MFNIILNEGQKNPPPLPVSIYLSRCIYELGVASFNLSFTSKQLLSFF